MLTGDPRTQRKSAKEATDYVRQLRALINLLPY